MAKTIAMFNQKGGVGKTTTCVNLACALTESGKKVLVVDTDPQGHSGAGLGVDKNAAPNVYDLLLNGVHPEWQKRGVHSIYYAEMNRNAIKHNVIWAYSNPQIIGNEAEKIWGTTYETEPLMTRAVFGKAI